MTWLLLVLTSASIHAADLASAAWPRTTLSPTTRWDDAVRALQTVEGDLLFYAMDLEGHMDLLRATMDRAAALEAQPEKSVNTYVSRLYERWPELKRTCTECAAFEDLRDPTLRFFRSVRALRGYLAAARGLPVTPATAATCRALTWSASLDALVQKLSAETLASSIESLRGLRTCLTAVVIERYATGFWPLQGQSSLFQEQ